MIKYFIGPMSKNIVDSIIEFDGNFGFIPSRRQVDYNGGYVNNWSTGEFTKYVDGRVPIERAHAGAGQGYIDDDGYGDGQGLAHDRFQLTHRKAETAIAHHRHHLALGHADLRTDRCRQCESQGAMRAIGDEAAPAPIELKMT